MHFIGKSKIAKRHFIASPRQQQNISLGTNSPDSSSTPPRKTRSLEEIYQNCDVTYISYEPKKYEEVVKDPTQRKAMDEEMKMIEKNNTWSLLINQRRNR